MPNRQLRVHQLPTIVVPAPLRQFTDHQNLFCLLPGAVYESWVLMGRCACFQRDFAWLYLIPKVPHQYAAWLVAKASEHS